MFAIWSRRMGFKESEPEEVRALARARQLAEEYPGERFHVLKAVTSVACAADLRPVLSHCLPVAGENEGKQ